jgi:hypothetical protein
LREDYALGCKAIDIGRLYLPSIDNTISSHVGVPHVIVAEIINQEEDNVGSRVSTLSTLSTLSNTKAECCETQQAREAERCHQNGVLRGKGGSS